jgi:hypothetical protein
MGRKWHIAVNKDGRGVTGREHRVIAQVIYLPAGMHISSAMMLCTDCS